MYDIDLESTELCLIDSGIQSLKNVPLGRQLCVLNLHNNAVCRIERLDSLINLKHLDLSSNRIQKLEGLGGLQALRTLNLSCNQIKVVEGLQNLRSLVKLNLSYNLVDDVSGFASVWGSGYKLSHVDLHGNKLNSVTRLVEALTGCDKLRLLTLSQGDSTNPLCHQQDYRSVVLRGLAQLQTLDGVSRDGQEAPATNILADIPGLESYLEYLLSTESGSSESQPAELITPKIDQALERFRNPGISSVDISSVTTGEEVTSEVSQVVSRGNTPIHQTGTADSTRLALLEAQLAQLMAKQTSVTNPSPSSSSGDTEKPVAKKVTKLKAKRDIDQTDDSGSETRSRARTPKGQKSRLRKKKSDPPSYQLQTKASQARAEAGVSSSAELADQSESPQRSVSRSPTRRLVSPHTVTVTVPDRRADHGPDQQARENAQSTYLALMKEVESERERRWKAEQAAKKLVDHVKELQHRAKNETSLQETSTQVNTRLKQVLMNEREAKLRLQEQLESANNELRAVREKLDVSREAEQSQRTALQAMEQTAARAESERLKIQAHEGKKVQEAQMRASAASREADILKNSVTTLKGQVQQLQELLATREQEFRAELKGRYTLESKELQDVLERENRKAEKLHLAQQQALQEKIDSLSKQYKDLEDEFRLALQIEANRFTELQSAYELCSQENAANKQSLATSQRKEDRTAAMLADLTALVKEQKGRIAELSKFKQEQTIEYKERVHTLEAHVEEARKRMLQLELTKQEKIKLESQVTAQESVIEGLRAERQLWGQELAQQGASLAQDRGRLDAQIETLKSELSIAKKQLEREADSVQIKTKMLEDQTETIRKLKQALLERDEDVKKAREEGVSVQRQLEAQLLEERTANQELQDSADQLTARKEELKRQVADLEAELEESKRAHGILNKRWKDKSELIGQLEQQVHQMKDTWEAKEQRLTKEKDEAVDRASVAVEKLRSVDDAFRRQLDAKEEQHRVEVAELERQKQAEVDSALQKVVAVEGEMRLLLQETEANKRGMEEKVKRLTQAFSDLQSGLT